MVEMVIVIAIIMIIAAFGLPMLMNTIYLSRARGAAIDLASLIQQARILAERKNTTIAVYAGSVETNVSGAFINCSTASCPSGGNGSTWQSGDPDVPYTPGVFNAAAASAPATLNPGFTLASAGTILYFNARGLPSTATGLLATTGFVFYLNDTHGDWAAVSVSAAGRSKVWMYTGGTWH